MFVRNVHTKTTCDNYFNNIIVRENPRKHQELERQVLQTYNEIIEMGKLLSNQTCIISPNKDNQVRDIGVEEEEEEFSKDIHEEVPTLHTKTVLTVMGNHLYDSSVYDGIYLPHFHFDGVHTAVPDFDENMLMTIDKTGMRKRIINSTIHLIMRKGI